MAESSANESNEASSKDTLDLSDLQGLSFGPDWASKDASTVKSKLPGGRSAGRGDTSERKDRRPQRSDRRPQRPPRGADSRGPGSGGGGQHPRDNRGAPMRETFEPTVDINFYPQDDAFDALVARLRASARTYQLFEIAHLLLEKPERFVVVVSNKPKKTESGRVIEPLFASAESNLPFLTEEEAIGHVLQNGLERFFDIEEVERDAPNGNFLMVNRCSITGALLGPPNYHRYQEFVQQHYAAKVSGMSFERFQSKIESVRDQESIDAWIDSMKRGKRYVLKEPKEGEPEAFETIESVRHFLILNRKDELYRSFESVRFAGKDIVKLPPGDIRRSVEAYHQQQVRFPLETANNIRGRLRRHKFTVYKKGAKGVSYVCAVKRKFRDSGTVFTNSIQELIEFIEANELIVAADLPHRFLGIAAASPPAEAAQKPDGGESADADAAGSVAAQGAQAEAASRGEPSEEDRKRLSDLRRDLRWLITEGYVTEYGDGRLYAPPPMAEPKKKEVESAGQTEPSASTPAPTETAPSTQANLDSAGQDDTPEARPDQGESARTGSQESCQGADGSDEPTAVAGSAPEAGDVLETAGEGPVDAQPGADGGTAPEPAEARDPVLEKDGAETEPDSERKA